MTRALALAAFALVLAASADADAEGTAPASSIATGDDAPATKAEVAAVRARLAEQEERQKRIDALLAMFRFSGFTQVDWTIHDRASQDEINGSTAQLLNQDRFSLRRGHVRLDVEKGYLLGALEIDANTTSGAQVRPIDAEVAVRWPAEGNAFSGVRPTDNGPEEAARDPERVSFLASAGLMRIPFGYEVQELDYVRPFLERATVMQAMFPGEFDLGARLKMKYRFLDGAIAVMNGSPIGDKVFPALAPVQAKDVVARLGVDVPVTSRVRLQAGISGVTGTGFHAGTPAAKPELVWQDTNGDGIVEPSEVVAVGGSPATPSQTFHRFALGGDARLIVRMPVVGDFTLRAEAVAGQNIDRGVEPADPVGAGRDLREVGWTVGATQELTSWAMIGVRYDTYDPDADSSSQEGVNLVPVDRTYATTALMAMLRYRGARLLFEYDINKNPLGVGANGAPTTLANDTATLRGQLVF